MRSHRPQTLKKQVEALDRRVAKIVDGTIAEAVRDFERPDVRKLLAQAISEQLKVDCSYVGIGEIRDRLQMGPILVRNL